MILFVYYLQQQQLQRQQLLLLIALLLQLSSLRRNFDVAAQWITVTEFSMRVPGRCSVTFGANNNSKNLRRQQFDCGGSQLLPQQRRCIPLQHFHDGIADCPDGSDEFCFPGYVKCGSYCVSLQYSAQCFINPKCDNSPTSPQFCDIIKEKLCSVEGTVPCKGYGECVMRKWIENGQTNCIDKSDQDLAYIAVFGIKRGNNLNPDLQFAFPNTSNNTNNIQRFVPSWLQAVSPSSSSLGLNDDTSRGSLSTMTEDWSNAITQPTTKKFIFRIPNNDLNDQDFKSSDSDTAVAEFSNKTGIANGSFQENHKVQQNFRNMVSNNGQHSSSTFRNFTVFVDDNQVEHNSGHNSVVTAVMYQLHSTTVKSDKADDSSIEIPQSSFIYRPGENPMDQISEKLENSIRASTNAVNSQNYEKLNDTRNKESLSSAKSSDAIRADNNSNRLRYRGSLKQDNAIEPNDISLSSPSSLDRSQNQHGISLNPSTDHLSNSITSSTSNDLFNTMVSATSSPSPDQMACARYEYAEAKRLVPKPSCTCPPGQMPSGGSGEHVTCKTTIISTFGVDVSEMCGGLETDPKERSRLAILVLNRTQLPYQACVRQDGHPVLVQLDCSQCTIPEFDEAFKRNSNDQYIPLRVTELSLGACWTSALNDCDPEHADCLVDGPRYECRCHEGWNDTSKEFGQAEGRRCEQLILFASGCIRFLGYCLFWWLLLLGIILFLILPLLCWLGYKLYKWCKKRRRRNVVEEQGHLVTSKIGSVKNTNPNLPTTESFNMNDNPSFIGSTNAAATINTKNISNYISDGNQNIPNVTERVLVKQQNMKSLDSLHKNDEVKSDGNCQPNIQCESFEQIFDGSKSERKKSEQQVMKTPVNHLISTDSSISPQKKTTSETQTESSEVSLESQRNTNMMVSVIPQKNIEMLIKDGKMMKNLENVEFADTKVMNLSRSLSETSLRTMWELFKQGMWKQSSRPSSIKSSTSSLDHLIDVFLCRTRSKKIHPDAIAISNNSPEYPLDTVKIVDFPDTAPQQSSTSFTTLSTTATTATTTTATAISADPLVQPRGGVNDVVQFCAETPMQTQIFEQKIVTGTKTLTTTSTVPLLPKEIPLSSTVEAQSSNPIISTALLNQSDSIQLNQKSVSDMVSIAANEISQQANLNDTTTDDIQHSAAEENAIIDQKSSTIIQIENETTDQPSTKPSTTTIVTSSDMQLKRWASTSQPISRALRQTQSDYGRRISMPRDSAEEKTPPLADELREALKEVASTKPPTKRLTEKQKEKLSASCGHLHIQADDEISRKGGSIRQLLATSRHEPRRKLSSISEKSIEMTNGGVQLTSALNSASCPTTTRISKGSVAAQKGNFNSVKCGSGKLEENRTNIKVRRKTDNDVGDWRQYPLSTVNLRPSWDFSPLKDGDLDRIAPLQPVFSRNNRPQKWLSALLLDDERATTLHQNKNINRHRQSDWNLHDISHTHALSASHSARLHAHFPPAKVLRNSSGIKWMPNGTQDHNKPVKEQLWWSGH